MAAGARRSPWVFTSIVILAAALRLPSLDTRPMHADEAVQAAKFAALLERGRYEYDPAEYHGPTLQYLTLIPASVRGITRYEDLDEVTLRLVPAVTGVLLVAAHVLLVPAVGFWAAAFAALFAAVSPAMVFYSRYYVHETLLTAFTFGALVSICRYLRTGHAAWAVALGVSLGLMHATKETSVIAFAAILGGLAVACLLARQHGAAFGGVGGRRTGVHLALAALTAACVSALFFSSFFTHPQGIVDSVAAGGSYFKRAAGSWHVHPWHYYLGLLFFSAAPGAPAWTEAAILVFGGAGAAVAWARWRRAAGSDAAVLVFLSVYTVLMTAAYAAIPYKTPWCVLGFLHGFVLMAGVAASRLVEACTVPLSRILVVALCLAAAAHLAWLAWAAGWRFSSDPRNPYVYAHTGTGVFEIARRVNELARVHPEGLRMPIEVISGQNLWPLPWYLRRFSKVRWEPTPVNDGFHAPVILATPDAEAGVVRKLYEWRQPGEREMYVPIFGAPVELRPQVEVRGYAAKTLWDEQR